MRRLLLLLAGGLVVLATCSAAVPARIDGLTLQVTSTADAVDDNPGDGVCHAAGLPATADCTLRAAVQTANATPGADTILLRGGTLVKSPAVYRLTISTPYEEAAAKGDLDVTDPLTIGVPGGRTRGIASGAPAIEGIGQDRIFDVKSAGSLTLTGVIVRGGVAGGGNEGFGGGIRAEGDLVLASDTITGNSADYGGGVSSATSLVASNTTFSKNRALLAGGIFDRGTISLSRVVVTNNTSVDPNVPLGGIENQGTATISSSTFDHNTGSGVWNFFSSSMTLANSTVTANIAPGSDGVGGGISNSGTLALSNSTITGNSASAAGGGVWSQGTTTLVNDTLTGNGAPTGGNLNLSSGLQAKTNAASTIFASPSSGGNCAGTPLISKGHNLEDGASCALTGPGDLSGQPPQLGPLTDNGGPALTEALLPGSPAIDAGDPTSCPATDERGVKRPTGNGCDIGAYEFAVTADVAVTLAGTPAQVAIGHPITYTASVTNKGPNAASGLNMTEAVPTGSTPVSAKTTAGSCTNGAVVQCALGGLSDQAKATVTIVVIPSTAGIARDVVSVKALQVDPDATTNSARVETIVVGPRTSTGGTSGFSAKIVSLHGRRVHGRAHVSVVLVLSAKVKARLALLYRRRRVVSKTIMLSRGRRTIKLAARQRSGRGRYVLSLQFSDAKGQKSGLRVRLLLH